MNSGNFMELFTKALKELTDKDEAPPKQYFTIEEVAKKLKVSKPTVISWLKDKKYPLPYFNFGKRQIRIKPDDLEAWIINHRSKIQEGSEKLIQVQNIDKRYGY